MFVSVDLADPDGPERCVAAADETFGTLHATVNCAAATFRGSVWDSTAAMWDEMMALNVRAACLAAQESVKPVLYSSNPSPIDKDGVSP